MTTSFSVLDALRRFREKPALTVGGETLSFADLERWSNALAEEVDPPVGKPQRCLGILAPSSFEYAAALCAIWKSGHLAVPLQPQHPMEELKYLVEDTGMDGVFVHD